MTRRQNRQQAEENAAGERQEVWKTRWLADREPACLWMDGVCVGPGLEKDKAAMLVVVTGLRDGGKMILAVESGYRKSSESWALVRELKHRSLRPVSRRR